MVLLNSRILGEKILGTCEQSEDTAPWDGHFAPFTLHDKFPPPATAPPPGLAGGGLLQ